MALHMFPASPTGWDTKVMTASGLHGNGVEESWRAIREMISVVKENGAFERRRKEQQIQAFQKLTEISIYEHVLQRLGKSGDAATLKQNVTEGKINEFAASLQLVNQLDQL